MKLEKDPSRKNKLKKKLLCQTIAQNPCYYLVITEFQDGKNENKNIKKTIILSSRIHPGESMASYIIENIIDFLTGYSVEAKILRENFIFKIIPMLNIDGVVNGNYRCNLAGVDLNRQWLMPQKSQHPTIYYARQLIKKCKEEKNLILFCDFHGHSRKKNIFMYGCQGKDNYRREMVFPLLIRNSCPVFQFKDCSFAIQKEREGSARIALWKDFNIINCYTLEVSFCGADFGKYEYLHFNLEIYKEISWMFCHSIIDCFEPEQTKVKAVMEEIENMVVKQNEKKNVGDDSSDGDSDYSNDDNTTNNNNNNNNNKETNFTQSNKVEDNEEEKKGQNFIKKKIVAKKKKG